MIWMATLQQQARFFLEADAATVCEFLGWSSRVGPLFTEIFLLFDLYYLVRRVIACCIAVGPPASRLPILQIDAILAGQPLQTIR